MDVIEKQHWICDACGYEWFDTRAGKHCGTFGRRVPLVSEFVGLLEGSTPMPFGGFARSWQFGELSNPEDTTEGGW